MRQRLAERRTAVWSVLAAEFLVATGVGSILPILPLFVRERHVGYGVIGVVVAANLIAQFIGQYPAGWLSDRVGRRVMMVGGLLLEALAVGAFVLPLPVEWLVAMRFAQGLGAAAFNPTARAAIADLVPAGERGIAYGWFASANMAGLIFGPAMGGLLAVFGRSVVFEVTALAIVLAAAVAGTAVGVRRGSVVLPPDHLERARHPIALPAVRGILLVMFGIGFLIGIYDVTWSLFMKVIGASDWMVGLSFSLFALPLVLMAPISGWAVNRWDRRWLAAASTASSALLAPFYPLLRNIPLVIGLGAVEAVGISFAEPAMNAFLMDSVEEHQRGSAAGTLGTAEAASTAIGSLSGGLLFTLGFWMPFYVGGAGCILLVLTAVPFLRAAGPDQRAKARPRIASSQ